MNVTNMNTVQPSQIPSAEICFCTTSLAKLLPFFFVITLPSSESRSSSASKSFDDTVVKYKNRYKMVQGARILFATQSQNYDSENILVPVHFLFCASFLKNYNTKLHFVTCNEEYIDHEQKCTHTQLIL